ncbi:MAG TPA: hypothetical protein VGT08_18715 [Terracidiphilus sp.]|nr:hypothetical protein [Terracidiphilus sp.]
MRSAAAARGARRALYSFLFIGLPGPGGLGFWFFVLSLRPDPPAQQVSPCEERAGRTAAQARKGRGSRAPLARPHGDGAKRRRRSVRVAGLAGGTEGRAFPDLWRCRLAWPGVGEF